MHKRRSSTPNRKSMINQPNYMASTKAFDAKKRNKVVKGFQYCTAETYNKKVDKRAEANFSSPRSRSNDQHKSKGFQYETYKVHDKTTNESRCIEQTNRYQNRSQSNDSWKYKASEVSSKIQVMNANRRHSVNRGNVDYKEDHTYFYSNKIENDITSPYRHNNDSNNEKTSRVSHPYDDSQNYGLKHDRHSCPFAPGKGATHGTQRYVHTPYVYNGDDILDIRPTEQLQHDLNGYLGRNQIGGGSNIDKPGVTMGFARQLKYDPSKYNVGHYGEFNDCLSTQSEDENDAKLKSYVTGINLVAAKNMDWEFNAMDRDLVQRSPSRTRKLDRNHVLQSHLDVNRIIGTTMLRNNTKFNHIQDNSRLNDAHERNADRKSYDNSKIQWYETTQEYNTRPRNNDYHIDKYDFKQEEMHYGEEGNRRWGTLTNKGYDVLDNEYGSSHYGQRPGRNTWNNIPAHTMSFSSQRNLYDHQSKGIDGGCIKHRSMDKEYRYPTESSEKYKHWDRAEDDTKKCLRKSKKDYFGNVQKNSDLRDHIDFHLRNNANQLSADTWATKVVSYNSKDRSIPHGFNDIHSIPGINTHIDDISNIVGGYKPLSRDIIGVNSIINKPGGKSSKDKHRFLTGNKLNVEDISDDRRQSLHTLPNMPKDYQKGGHSYDKNINDRHREADKIDLGLISSGNAQIDLTYKKEPIRQSAAINTSNPPSYPRKISADIKLNKDISKTHEVEKDYRLLNKATVDVFKDNISRRSNVRDEAIKPDVPRTNILPSEQPTVTSTAREYFSPSPHLDTKSHYVSLPNNRVLGDINLYTENVAVKGNNGVYLLDKEIKDELKENKPYFDPSHHVGLFPGESIITNIPRHSEPNSTFSKHRERDNVSSGNIHDTQDPNPSFSKPLLWEDNKNHLGEYGHVDHNVTMTGSANQNASDHKHSVDKSRLLFVSKSNIKEFMNDGGKTPTDKISHSREPPTKILQNDIKYRNAPPMMKSTINSSVHDTTDHGGIPSHEKGIIDSTLDKSFRDSGLNTTPIVPRQWENISPSNILGTLDHNNHTITSGISENKLPVYRDNDPDLRIDGCAKEYSDAILSPRSKDIEEYRRTVPVSLENPRGFCFFNSVIQVLRCCLDFNYEMIKYHKQSLIGESNSAATDNDKSFVIRFCKLLFEMSLSNTGAKAQYYGTLKGVHQYFQQSADGDDVQKCLMLVLTMINNVIKANPPGKGIKSNASDKAEASFSNYRNKNKGFIFDLFYGQMSHSTKCNQCGYVKNVTYQMFKTLPLPVLSNNKSTTLLKCIECFFQPSNIDLDEKMDCNCEDGSSMDFCSQSKITHAPKYLFIYLTRGSYYLNGVKNDTFVTFDETMDIPVENGKVPYRLISVIDHIGDNEGGHYYCRCNYEGEEWWSISDTRVQKLGRDFEQVRSKQAIAFMYKKSQS